MNNEVNDNLKCPNCGQVYQTGVTFCGNCGYNLASQSTTNNQPKNVKPKEEEKIELERIDNFDKPPKKPNMTFFNLLIIVFLLGVGGVIGYQYWQNKKNAFTDVFNENQLVAIKQDGKYGYIDTDGNMVIEPKYIKATDFHGDYGMVYTTNKDENGEEDDVYAIIDRKGNIKITVDYSSDIKYYDVGVWLIDGTLYDLNLKQLSNPRYTVYDIFSIFDHDNTYFRWEDIEKTSAGIMDQNGKILYKYLYKKGEFSLTVTPVKNDGNLNNYCVISIDNKSEAIVNCDNGKVIYDFTSNDIISKDNNIFEIDNSDGEFVELIFINNDKIAYKTESDLISLNYYDGYLTIQDTDSNEIKYYDTENDNIVEKQESKLFKTNFEKETGITKKKCDDKYGLLENNKEILKCEYSNINFFNINTFNYLKSKGMEYVITYKDGKSSLVNLKNNKVEKEFAGSYVVYGDSTFVYSTVIYNENYSSKYEIYNMLSKQSINVDASNIILFENYIVVKENYYNTDLKIFYTE